MVDIAATISGLLVGRKLSGVQRREYDWVFEFENSAVLTAECPWRILSSGIAFADGDHGQQFGLPAALDGEQEANRLLSDKPTQAANIREDTGDLAVVFGGGTTLELLNLSGGYEGWQLVSGETHIIALGGGEVVIYSDARSGG